MNHYYVEALSQQPDAVDFPPFAHCINGSPMELFYFENLFDLCGDRGLALMKRVDKFILNRCPYYLSPLYYGSDGSILRKITKTSQ